MLARSTQLPRLGPACLLRLPVSAVLQVARPASFFIGMPANTEASELDLQHLVLVARVSKV